MATAKYATPSAQGSNIASTTLDSLANAGTSTFVTHDNSSNLDLYASVLVNLGSITPTTGGSITLRVFSAQSSDAPDATGSVGGGDAYTQPLTTSASAKVVVFPMVRLYPESLRLCITNNSGVTLAGSSNSIKVRPYCESVA
jgi:hypothetical protein